MPYILKTLTTSETRDAVHDKRLSICLAADGFSYTDPCSVYGYGTKEHTRDQENALNHHYDLSG